MKLNPGTVRSTISNLGGRKFLLVVMSPVVYILNLKFNLGISEEAIDKFATLIMLFVGGESAVDVAAAIRRNS